MNFRRGNNLASVPTFAEAFLRRQDTLRKPAGFPAKVGNVFEVGHVVSGPRPMRVPLSFVLLHLQPESGDLITHQHTPICEVWLQKRYENATKFVLEFKMAGD
jgi:hypothetical protein